MHTRVNGEWVEGRDRTYVCPGSRCASCRWCRRTPPTSATAATRLRARRGAAVSFARARASPASRSALLGADRRWSRRSWRWSRRGDEARDATDGRPVAAQRSWRASTRSSTQSTARAAAAGRRSSRRGRSARSVSRPRAPCGAMSQQRPLDAAALAMRPSGWPCSASAWLAPARVSVSSAVTAAERARARSTPAAHGDSRARGRCSRTFGDGLTAFTAALYRPHSTRAQRSTGARAASRARRRARDAAERGVDQHAGQAPETRLIGRSRADGALEPRATCSSGSATSRTLALIGSIALVALCCWRCASLRGRPDGRDGIVLPALLRRRDAAAIGAWMRHAPLVPACRRRAVPAACARRSLLGAGQRATCRFRAPHQPDDRRVDEHDDHVQDRDAEHGVEVGPGVLHDRRRRRAVRAAAAAAAAIAI